MVITFAPSSNVVYADEANKAISGAGIKFIDRRPPKNTDSSSNSMIEEQRSPADKARKALPMTNKKTEST
ncbi:hypothetical protein [Candidatus Enterococcus ikei]|uniref:Uncharacterized protein n=1 Tax=Candidatus Enterococcus ikei TaxID=2815326 RepID=A0ABS3GZQ4_9ENTE|nr:hypothetical protein [Enterococcus sp. DIV0869a]MBO0440741.1 hypothetical protein [Enterococcus sp. DIV0869a]